MIKVYYIGFLLWLGRYPVLTRWITHRLCKVWPEFHEWFNTHTHPITGPIKPPPPSAVSGTHRNV